MSLKLYEILCPDGFVKNGYNKAKLSTIFGNSMNSSDKPNKDFSHIDNKAGDKVSIYEFSSYPKNSVFEIHLDSDCSPIHLSPDTIEYLESYKRTGQLVEVVIISNGRKLDEVEESIVNRLSNTITYK
jgi:hypothetical protein